MRDKNRLMTGAITVALGCCALFGATAVQGAPRSSAKAPTTQQRVARERAREQALLKERMDPVLAEKIYELDRCIECGCCVAGCGTARMREDFVGAVGLNKIARFRLDPRDRRTDDDYYELIGDDDGVFGCMSLMACHDVCPKDLPLATQIAFLRRKMVSVGWK
jgi:fumarate reductase iron-sulfur subunit